jgi:hypothetical protein
MIKHEYQSEFARTYYTKGREEGRIEMVLELAAMKLGRLTPADETRIRAITDAALLRAIVTSLARAEDDADARVVFERMVPPPASENH